MLTSLWLDRTEFLLTRRMREFNITARAIGESTNDGSGRSISSQERSFLWRGKLGRRDRFWMVGKPETIRLLAKNPDIAH